MTAWSPEQAATVQSTEYLRRWYAKATDLIGIGDAASVEEGRAIYHRIFTPDVEIRTAPVNGESLSATGPDEWVDIVKDALDQYVGTQHLIGTQLVEFVDGNEARMESYLNGWHHRPDNSAMIFLGTYIDLLRRTDAGWQIYDMTLERVAQGESPAYDE